MRVGAVPSRSRQLTGRHCACQTHFVFIKFVDRMPSSGITFSHNKNGMLKLSLAECQLGLDAEVHEDMSHGTHRLKIQFRRC